MKKRSPPKEKPELVAALPEGRLEERALSYLNRFDATRHKLSFVLGRYVRRAVTLEGRESALEEVTRLLDRYEGSGLIDDRRFSANHTRSLWQRGSSQRKTAQKLRLRGIAPELIADTFEQLASEMPGGDLAAALIYVRKRRLGPHRASDEERQAKRQKDLASLARQGFSHDVAKRALAATDDVF